MANINLNLYKIFCKVAESKSYYEAAEKLDLSVPNISIQIANLEDQLNMQLFCRDKKGVTLTENGRELYEIVNKSISSFDFAEKMAKEKNSIETGSLKIGCPSHFTSYYLMEKISKAKKDYNDLHISILCEVDKNKLKDLLINHQIDFIITDSIIEGTNIVTKELETIKNIFVSKAPLKISNIKELENLNCILNYEWAMSTQQLKKILEPYNVKIKSNIECDATEIRVEAVKRNLGIAYVIKEAVIKELEKEELYEVELPLELPTINLNLIHLDGELTKVDKEFIKEYLFN